MNFLEYLNSKKKLVEKPSDCMDYDDAVPERREKSKGEKGSPAPYSTTKAAKDPNKKEPGLADKGKKDKGYELPDDNKWKTVKTKTEAWLDELKGRPLSEFINKVKEEIEVSECVCEDKFGTIKEAVKLASINENYLKGLILEFRRNGEFSSLVEAVLNYEESFEVIGKLVNNDPLSAKWLSEAVAPPAHEAPEEHDDLDDLDDTKEPRDGEDGSEQHGLDDEEGDDDFGDEGDEGDDESGLGDDDSGLDDDAGDGSEHDDLDGELDHEMNKKNHHGQNSHDDIKYKTVMKI